MFRGVCAVISCTAVKVQPKEGDTVDRQKYYQVSDNTTNWSQHTTTPSQHTHTCCLRQASSCGMTMVHAVPIAVCDSPRRIAWAESVVDALWHLLTLLLRHSLFSGHHPPSFPRPLPPCTYLCACRASSSMTVRLLVTRLRPVVKSAWLKPTCCHPRPHCTMSPALSSLAGHQIVWLECW